MPWPVILPWMIHFFMLCCSLLDDTVMVVWKERIPLSIDFYWWRLEMTYLTAGVSFVLCVYIVFPTVRDWKNIILWPSLQIVLLNIWWMLSNLIVSAIQYLECAPFIFETIEADMALIYRNRSSSPSDPST
jgi:hypothetical protein